MDHSPLDEEAIFHTARKIENPEARAEYLAQICAGDIRLRERVEALLRVNEDDGAFLRPAVVPSETTVGDSVPEPHGRIIGRYKLLQQIGRGGFGVVYMAEQERPIRRKVALKLSFPGRDSRQVIARFEAERQALSLMEHPNIARVFDAGATDDELPYFVMELVRGEPITKYCDDRNLSARRRLELFLPVCHAIQHAHQKGVIHRDIKPSNILVAEYDEHPMAKVIDFGVAKAVSQPLTDKTMFTGFGQILGTLEYMSPEQAKLNQLDIDTRSDIYSLGVVLYELLVGELPFDRERFRTTSIDEILRIIREEDPPKPSLRLTSSRQLTQNAVKRDIDPQKLRSLVQGELDWIVMKCLEKDRARRYETANGLAKDLQRYLDDEPVLARPPTTRYRLGKFARRNRSLVSTIFAIMLALTVGLGIATWQAVEAEKRREESEQQLYLADMVRAWDAWTIGNLNEAERLLERHRPGPSDRDRRGVEWHMLAAELEVPERIRRLTTSGLPVNLAMSADGSILAAYEAQGRLTVYQTKDGSAQSFSCRPGDILTGAVAISDSGYYLVYPGDSGTRFQVRDLRTLDLNVFETELGFTATSFCPTSEKHWLAVATGSATGPDIIGAAEVILWDIETGKQIWKNYLRDVTITRFAWSSDGRILAGGSENGYAFVWDVKDGRELCSIHVGDQVSGVAIVADDTLLATVGFASAQNDIRLWDCTTGALVDALPGHSAAVMGLARLPNGDLASCGRDNLIRIWDISTRREKQRLRGHSHNVSRLAAAGTADEPILASAGDDFQVGIWQLASTEQTRAFRTDAPRQVAGLALSSNEQQVFSVSYPPRFVEVRSRRTGELARVLPCSSTPFGLAIDSRDRIAVGCTDGRVLFFDKLDAEPRELPRQPFNCRAIAFAPITGKLAASGHPFSDAEVSEVSILASDSFQSVARLPVPKGLVLRVVWSPDETLLAASGDHGIRVWRTDTWEVTFDGKHDGLQVPDVTFSPDGTLLASCGWDSTVRFWDPITGDPVGEPLRSHAGRIWELRFSPDGKTLFTTSGDETLGVWDVESRELRARIPDHIGGSKALCVSKSGTWLLTGGLWDNKIHIRRLRPEAEP